MLNEKQNNSTFHNFLEEKHHMRFWKKFLIIGAILSIASFILIPISQIRIEFPEVPQHGTTHGTTISKFPVYPYSWLLLPATIILTTGTVSIIYGYLVKRAYG